MNGSLTVPGSRFFWIGGTCYRTHVRRRASSRKSCEYGRAMQAGPHPSQQLESHFPTPGNPLQRFLKLGYRSSPGLCKTPGCRSQLIAWLIRADTQLAMRRAPPGAGSWHGGGGSDRKRPRTCRRRDVTCHRRERAPKFFKENRTWTHFTHC